MPIHRFYLSDFVAIQRNSFLNFLEKGLIEEFSKRNPITNATLEVYFYPEYYQLTAPKYSARQAIIKGKSYASRLYIPVQLTDKQSRVIKFKWVYLGDIPIMTKRGHFIINGATRVIVNQIIRSPGIYYQTKLYENFSSKWAQKASSFFERHYADIICQRGTWLRLEVDKEKRIWAQTKRGPKIPIMWLLLAMGLNEKIIFKSIIDPHRLLYNMFSATHKLTRSTETKSGSTGSTGLVENLDLESAGISFPNNTSKKGLGLAEPSVSKGANAPSKSIGLRPSLINSTKPKPDYIKTPPEAWARIYSLFTKQNPSKTDGTRGAKANNDATDLTKKSKSADMETDMRNAHNIKNKKISPRISIQKTPTIDLEQVKEQKQNLSELGRQLIFNKFMNPRTYDLGKYGRLNINKKLNLTVSPYQTTLTPQDLLAATDYLLKVENGLKNVDDIDHLRNRRVRTSGELIQLQLGIGLVRLEKTIREKLEFFGDARNRISFDSSQNTINGQATASTLLANLSTDNFKNRVSNMAPNTLITMPSIKAANSYLEKKAVSPDNQKQAIYRPISINSLMNTKPLNSALREFFGTSPLSQFMDQINPLAEITHKRRLSSMGPGGVTRDSATLDIRGIHPSHYGRICPVETPEGKNTGLVNSLTTYARVNAQGFIETPFYKVYKGQVQKKAGMYFFSAEQEDKIKLGAADLTISDIGFLSKSNIPVRIDAEFSKISRNVVEYVGISPLQMVSIATSLIPFLEHDDANRALMGSNMQRQAVPILKPERPIVGTGLEARAVSDSGHALQTKSSGVITYVSADKIILYT
jgi:DNA-directed RNA polymerase beta subunit